MWLQPGFNLTPTLYQGESATQISNPICDLLLCSSRGQAAMLRLATFLQSDWCCTICAADVYNFDSPMSPGPIFPPTKVRMEIGTGYVATYVPYDLLCVK